MTNVVELDMKDLSVTPIFKHVTVEDVPASEAAGQAVYKTFVAVEVRLGGSKNYSPVFPAEEFWKRDGVRIITYAERWPDQYRRFMEGNSQEAAGTPLEMLKTHGITDAQLSLCRAVKIYSIEALHQLEGPGLKSLGMSVNSLKDMARKFMAAKSAAVNSGERIAELEAQIAALMKRIPEQEATPAEVDAAIAAADAEAVAGQTVPMNFDAMDDAALKQLIKDKTGQAPRGTPKHEDLVNIARELAA